MAQVRVASAAVPVTVSVRPTGDLNVNCASQTKKEKEDIIVNPAEALLVEDNYDDSGDNDDSSSVDTADALMDMLGLDLAKEKDDDENKKALFSLPMEEEKECYSNKSTDPKVIPIRLPPKCSRYGVPSSKCAAVVIPKFYSPSECQALLNLAKLNGFDYVKEAAFTAPDGSTHTVQLQNPNPHKLAVLEHAPTIEHIWNKLQPYLRQKWIVDYSQRTNYGPPV